MGSGSNVWGWSAFRIAVVLLVTVCDARATQVFFDAGDLSQFHRNGAASTNYAINATAGTGGGSGLVISSDANGKAVIPTSFMFPATGTATLAFEYKQGASSNVEDMEIGFCSDLNATVFAATNSVWLQVLPNNVSTSHFMQVLQNDSAGQTGVNFNPTSVTFGDWYRMQLQLDRTGSTTLLATLDRFDLGPNGISLPQTIQHGTTTLSLGDLLTHPLFPALSGTSVNPAYDNFQYSVVATPEPGSVGGLMLLVAMLCGHRTRASRALQRV